VRFKFLLIFQIIRCLSVIYIIAGHRLTAICYNLLKKAKNSLVLNEYFKIFEVFDTLFINLINLK